MYKTFLVNRKADNFTILNFPQLSNGSCAHVCSIVASHILSILTVSHLSSKANTRVANRKGGSEWESSWMRQVSLYLWCTSTYTLTVR